MLATIAPDGRPHLVPITHAVVGDEIVFAVDHKPKRDRRLRRLDNIAADPRVTVLFDRREEDWSELWWVRADGRAVVHELAPPSAEILVERHPAYRRSPPAGPWVSIAVERWTGWSASEV